jgi:hypothetical protein
MEAHRREHGDLGRWQSLEVGREITVIKRSPDGEDAARYSAVIVARAQEDDWVALRARWTYRRVEVDQLVFNPGDELIEWFSPALPFNAFAVLSPGGELRGWYANVTYPAFLEPLADGEPSVALVWHDLYLDLVGLPDASFVVRDEDELADSGLEAADSRLHTEIVAAVNDLVQRFISQQMPFCLVDGPDFPGESSLAVPE